MERDLNLNPEHEMKKLKERVKIKDWHKLCRYVKMSVYSIYMQCKDDNHISREAFKILPLKKIMF